MYHMGLHVEPMHGGEFDSVLSIFWFDHFRSTDVTDASNDENQLLEGHVYMFRGKDEDGDFALGSQARRHLLFYEDLDIFFTAVNAYVHHAHCVSWRC